MGFPGNTNTPPYTITARSKMTYHYIKMPLDVVLPFYLLLSTGQADKETVGTMSARHTLEIKRGIP